MTTAAAGGPGRKGQIIVSVITVIHLQPGRQAAERARRGALVRHTLGGATASHPSLLCRLELGFSGRKVCLEHTLLATDIVSLSPEQQNPS